MAGQWICAQTYPMMETISLRHLHQQKFNAFFPYFMQKPKNRSSASIKPLFPGYIFAEVNDNQPWMPINSTTGIVRVLTRKRGNYTVPWSVPEEFVDSFHRIILSSDNVLGAKIQPGARVRVTRGAMIDQEALVEWRKEKRIGLLFSILGREVEVQFHLNDLELV